MLMGHFPDLPHARFTPLLEGRVPLKTYIASLTTSTAIQQMMKVGVVGVLNTAVSFAVFNLLLTILGGTKPVDEGFNWEQFWAIAFSFVVATAFSYGVNRRWTFGLVGRGLVRRESARFLAINVGAWALTQVVVGGADALWGPLTATRSERRISSGRCRDHCSKVRRVSRHRVSEID